MSTREFAGLVFGTVRDFRARKNTEGRRNNGQYSEEVFWDSEDDQEAERQIQKQKQNMQSQRPGR